MTGWKARRFWKTAEAVGEGQAFTVRLDGRPVLTPAKAALTLPTRPMAEAVAAEWQDAPAELDPRRMPVTRAANAAIDKVAPNLDAVRAEICRYAETDLLCYRAPEPEALADRQRAGWDPVLAWAAAELGAELSVTVGVTPIAQPRAALGALRQAVATLGPFRLTALHDLVALTGSLILGLAASRDFRPVDEVWRLSRIDEDWQADVWGRDAEAASAAAARHRAFVDAHRFWHLAG